jgi:hypothetical protein
VAITLVVALTLALNLLSGSYSGIVHAHAHEHAQSDHHHDDDHTDVVDRASAGAGVVDAGDAGDKRAVDQTHEHPADLALSLTPFAAWKYPVVAASWSALRNKPIVLTDVAPSERPPRFA